MGQPIFSPGKEWAGPFFPRGKTDRGEIPACYKLFYIGFYRENVEKKQTSCLKPHGLEL